MQTSTSFAPALPAYRRRAMQDRVTDALATLRAGFAAVSAARDHAWSLYATPGVSARVRLDADAAVVKARAELYHPTAALAEALYQGCARSSAQICGDSHETLIAAADRFLRA